MHILLLPANNEDNHVYQHRHLRLTIISNSFHLRLRIQFLMKTTLHVIIIFARHPKACIDLWGTNIYCTCDISGTEQSSDNTETKTALPETRERLAENLSDT